MSHAYKMLVDGQLVDGTSSFDVINPANEQVVSKCPKSDEAQLNAAVAAAKRAFPAWASKTQDERAALVDEIADRLMARADEFARLLTAEQGKPLDQAQYEVMGTVFTLKGFAKMRVAEKIMKHENGHKVFEHRTPLGVCAAITPWNFPMILLANKLAPCLITGNTMVAKPAPTTPLTSLLLGEIIADVLPAGVVNIIVDQNDLGGLLSSHPDIAKIGFTGSTATGKNVWPAPSARGILKCSDQSASTYAVSWVTPWPRWTSARLEPQ